MSSVLKRTDNVFSCIGTVEEINLKREPADIKVRDKDGNDAGTKKGERVIGNFSVKIAPNNVVVLNVFVQSLNNHGEANRQWDMATAMMNWTPAIGDNGQNEAPTMVRVRGSIEINDYVNRSGKVSSSLRYRVNSANTRVDSEATPGLTVDVTAFVNSIKPEIVNNEETGRLKVMLYGVNYSGQCFPIEAYVDESAADDFESTYEVGDTAPFTLDLTGRVVGNVNTPSVRKFGKSGKVNTKGGFVRNELIIVGADDVIDEPDDDEEDSQWIDPAGMKKAIKVRQQMLEELERNGGNTSRNVRSELANSKRRNSSGNTSIPAKRRSPVDDDDEDFDTPAFDGEPTDDFDSVF